MRGPIELQESYYDDLEARINKYKQSNLIEKQAYLFRSKMDFLSLKIRLEHNPKDAFKALAKEMYFINYVDLLAQGETIDLIPKFDDLFEVLSTGSIYADEKIGDENCITSIRNNLARLESSGVLKLDKAWIKRFSEIVNNKIDNLQSLHASALNNQKLTQDEIWNMLDKSISNLILTLPPSMQANLANKFQAEIETIKQKPPKNEGEVVQKMAQIEKLLNDQMKHEIKNDKIKLGFKFAALSLCIISIATVLSGIGLILAGAICYKYWDVKVKEYAALQNRFTQGIIPLTGHTVQFFKPPKPLDTENVPVSIPQNFGKSSNGT